MFDQVCPTFSSYTGEEAAKRHQQIAQDGVEDLLSKMIESWEKDELYMAEQMAEQLRAPLLDLIAGGTERLRAECDHMFRLMDEVDSHNGKRK